MITENKVGKAGGPSLSEKIREFLNVRVRSVEELDILFLLRSDPSRRWDVVDVARSLGIEPLSASQWLTALYRSGAVEHQELRGRFYHYVYRPIDMAGEAFLTEMSNFLVRNRSEIESYLGQKKSR